MSYLCAHVYYVLCRYLNLRRALSFGAGRRRDDDRDDDDDDFISGERMSSRVVYVSTRLCVCVCVCVCRSARAQGSSLPAAAAAVVVAQ
jgi:hypothetical protein